MAYDDKFPKNSSKLINSFQFILFFHILLFIICIYNLYLFYLKILLIDV